MFHGTRHIRLSLRLVAVGGEEKHVFRQFLGAETAFLDNGEGLEGHFPVVRGEHGKLCISEHSANQVVEFMGDAGGQLAKARQFLHLGDLLLERTETDQHADPGQEFTGFDRFDEVVIRPDLEPENLLVD